jgi:Sigma-70 region 2
VFYDRHVRAVLGYFARRTGDPEVAGDLTAETFASALAARRRYRPAARPAGGLRASCPGGPYRNTLAAGVEGAYLATGENGSVTRLSSDGRVEWTVAVGANGPIAVAEHAVWVTAEDGTQRNAQLLRLDPADGHVTGRMRLRSRLPVGLVAVGDEVWAVLSDQTALVVR